MATHLVLAERHQRSSRQSIFIAGENISSKTQQVLAGRCPALWTAVCGRACTPGRQDALLTACVHSAEQGRRQIGARRDARRAQADWELVADLQDNALCQREGAAVQSCGRHLLHRQPHCAPSMLSVFKQQYVDFKSRPSALYKGVLSSHTAALTRSPFTRQKQAFNFPVHFLVQHGGPQRPVSPHQARHRPYKPLCKSTVLSQARCPWFLDYWV